LIVKCISCGEVLSVYKSIRFEDRVERQRYCKGCNGGDESPQFIEIVHTVELTEDALGKIKEEHNKEGAYWEGLFNKEAKALREAKWAMRNFVDGLGAMRRVLESEEMDE
jgi:hypothetical protein